MPAAPSGYDPRRSKVSANTMETFRVEPLTGDLLEVPGIGPAAVKALSEEGILNTYHLIGHYMKMATTTENETSIDIYQLNQDFWFFLQRLKINSNRSAIVKAICDKVATSYPAFHDANVYDDEE
ncbi:hypothetical protein ACA910_017728 [Epithemia clementina (nom. ined.)]